ncbi:MAG: KOW motif-containing protein [Crenarchaeota archaeon]|nr:KOW motif-containing protein [Thermoproteota archaeon]MCR8454753.1 KOW motif-containing protein [Thermoproteota archaeon]
MDKENEVKKFTETSGSPERDRKPIFIVSVPKNRAIDALILIKQRAQILNLPIYSAIIIDKHPDLIYVEADDYSAVAQAIAYFRYARAFETPLDALEFDELRRSIEDAIKHSREVEEKKEIEFKVGQIVRIIHGPFKDKTARIVSVSKTKLFLDLMVGATLIIEVKPEDVELVSE